MNTSKSSQEPHSTPGWVKFIDEEDVRRVLTWDHLLPVVRRSLVAFSLGPQHQQGAIQPLRTRMNIPDHQGCLLIMPGLLKENSIAVKILSIFHKNAGPGLSSHNALVVLMHGDTGLPFAILQGNVITEMRTAAASAVATSELLKKKDLQHGGTTIAVLGAGTQGRSHARVMAYILKPIKIMLWSRRLEAAKELCTILCSEGIPAEAVSTVQEAVKDADIINTCTRASAPLLKAEWVKSGAHINSIGAPTPDGQEMEEELVRAATIYTDSYESARAESGDIIKSGAEVYAEIGEVILGRKPVRHDKITIFKSLGLAVEDAATGKLVYDLLKAEEKQ